jgi:hypothetical protein
MKNSLLQKYPQSLNPPKLKIQDNRKTNFRHRDRGIHAGRGGGK